MRFFCVILLVMAGCASAPTRPPLFMSGDGPVYPAAAKAQGVEGYVEVEYDVTTEGTVEDAEVVEAEPDGVFEEAALEAIRQWRYKPMVIKGEVRRAEDVHSILRFEIGEPDRYEEF